MNLKTGMKVKLVNLPAHNMWDGVVCKVGAINGYSAELFPIDGFPEKSGTLSKQSWDKHLKIVNMSMVNK